MANTQHIIIIIIIIDLGTQDLNINSAWECIVPLGRVGKSPTSETRHYAN